MARRAKVCAPWATPCHDCIEHGRGEDSDDGHHHGPVGDPHWEYVNACVHTCPLCNPGLGGYARDPFEVVAPSQANDTDEGRPQNGVKMAPPRKAPPPKPEEALPPAEAPPPKPKKAPTPLHAPPPKPKKALAPQCPPLKAAQPQLQQTLWDVLKKLRAELRVPKPKKAQTPHHAPPAKPKKAPPPPYPPLKAAQPQLQQLSWDVVKKQRAEWPVPARQKEASAKTAVAAASHQSVELSVGPTPDQTNDAPEEGLMLKAAPPALQQQLCAAAKPAPPQLRRGMARALQKDANLAPPRKALQPKLEAASPPAEAPPPKPKKAPPPHNAPPPKPKKARPPLRPPPPPSKGQSSHEPYIPTLPDE